jgi:hypothetical protein
MLNTIEAEVTLENCCALINQIIAGRSAEEPFVNVSSAAELLFYLERAASAFERSAHARKSVGRRRSSPSIIAVADGPRLRTLHNAEDIGSVLEGSVKVCKQPLVNEVLGLHLTEFFPDPTYKGATPIQRGL